MTAAAEPLETRVWSALAEIDDPEMPVNLVDLGLIYGVEVGEGTVRLRLTFTAMGCPATDMIMGDIRTRLLAEPGVDDVVIDVVWDPPWSSTRLTPEGRARAARLGALGLMGYTRVHREVREYVVFARKVRVEPLRQVGSVVAPDDELAKAYARATYDEERWVEMMIVPKDAVISLWAPGEESD